MPAAIAGVRGMVVVMAMSLLLVGPVSADSRCNGGKGVQIWESPRLTASTTKFCTNSNGVILVPKLSQVTDGLFFFANWNDRVSSWQTFNASSPWRACMYHNESYTGTIQRLYGTNTWDYVGDSNNDKFSSLRSSSTC